MMKLYERAEEALLSTFKKTDGSINVAKASRQIKVSRQAIMYWLNEEVEEITLSNLIKIEHETGYSKTWIAFEEGEKFANKIESTHPDNYALTAIYNLKNKVTPQSNQTLIKLKSLAEKGLLGDDDWNLLERIAERFEEDKSK